MRFANHWASQRENTLADVICYTGVAENSLFFWCVTNLRARLLRCMSSPSGAFISLAWMSRSRAHVPCLDPDEDGAEWGCLQESADTPFLTNKNRILWRDWATVGTNSILFSKEEGLKWSPQNGTEGKKYMEDPEAPRTTRGMREAVNLLRGIGNCEEAGRRLIESWQVSRALNLLYF